MSVNLFPQSHLPSHPSTNRLRGEDEAAHDWYRFVLSFPAHLVRDYLRRWELASNAVILDPFCGTGTTLVEAKKNGFASVGVEANPVVHFAAHTKTCWRENAPSLSTVAEQVARRASETAVQRPLHTFTSAQEQLLLKGSISPLPLHKSLCLREAIASIAPQEQQAHLRLALAKVAVATASNLKFGPEVGVSGRPKEDAPVVEAWQAQVERMDEDLHRLQDCLDVPTTVIKGDARCLADHVAPLSIDAVFTSPPYPNEKDYSRTTRLETVLLGYAATKAELQSIKRGLLRSNTRNVYVGDDDDTLVEHFERVQEIAAAIEARRIALGKTSGFERLYAKVTRLYFGGMARHLANLRPLLRPGARLGYVVGDQASYLRVLIRTGQILAEVAISLGYEVERIDLFRTRRSTATGEELREEVVLLRWPG